MKNISKNTVIMIQGEAERVRLTNALKRQIDHLECLLEKDSGSEDSENGKSFDSRVDENLNDRDILTELLSIII